MMFGWLILLRSMENLRIPQKLCYMYIYIYIFKLADYWIRTTTGSDSLCMGFQWLPCESFVGSQEFSGTLFYVCSDVPVCGARLPTSLGHPVVRRACQPVDPNQSMLLDVSRNADFMSFILILYNNYILLYVYIYIYDMHVQHIYICIHMCIFYIHMYIYILPVSLCCPHFQLAKMVVFPEETMHSTAGHHVARRPGRLSTSDQEGRPAIRGLHETWGNLTVNQEIFIESLEFYQLNQEILGFFGILPVESRDTWI